MGSLGRGTGIAFDYFVPTDRYSEPEMPGFSTLRSEVAAIGEPWKSEFYPADMAEKLKAAGFDKVQDLSSTDMGERYFSGRDDGLTTTGPIRFVYAAHLE
ncbi:hypothetical protein [Neoroseomonas terrae]|uniref:hypothetical protein n=1 Tax=Neoroseomonas terrae TaxID=424799 RepID=UPI001FE7AC99|nr:hypothetical protein [Neoroseomonas terrae]